MRAWIGLIPVIAVVALTSCAAKPSQRVLGMGPVDTGPGSLAEARRYLEGRWALESFTVHPPGREPIAVAGTGFLVYDGYSNLDVEIRVEDRFVKPLADVGVPTVDGVLSTKGRTAIDLQARTLTYILDGQPPTGAPTGPLGLNRPRHWQVDGKTLTLTTRGDDGQPLSVGRWVKLEG